MGGKVLKQLTFCSSIHISCMMSFRTLGGHVKDEVV